MPAEPGWPFATVTVARSISISFPALDAEAFCRRLLTEARVLMFPGTAFGEQWKDYARISLLQTEEVLEEALARIARFSS